MRVIGKRVAIQDSVHTLQNQSNQRLSLSIYLFIK